MSPGVIEHINECGLRELQDRYGFTLHKQHIDCETCPYSKEPELCEQASRKGKCLEIVESCDGLFAEVWSGER